MFREIEWKKKKKETGSRVNSKGIQIDRRKFIGGQWLIEAKYI